MVDGAIQMSHQKKLKGWKVNNDGVLEEPRTGTNTGPVTGQANVERAVRGA